MRSMEQALGSYESSSLTTCIAKTRFACDNLYNEWQFVVVRGFIITRTYEVRVRRRRYHRITLLWSASCLADQLKYEYIWIYTRKAEGDLLLD